MTASIKRGVWPQRDSVVKSVDTVLSQIYLNKLFIPDVLIDIIKDYIYISEAEILKKFHRFCLNVSISRLSRSLTYHVDMYGRKRLAHWATGQYCQRELLPVQLQQLTCMTCGESSTYHTNIDGCCVLEFDGEDGTLILDEVSEDWTLHAAAMGEPDIDLHQDEDDEYDRYQDYSDDEFDRYNEDEWYAGDRRRSRMLEDDF